VAFVCEPTGHLVAAFEITPDGASFRSRNAFNLLASDDEWASPIMAEVGPDSCVWILDWYNYIVQHNPTPIGFQTGKGNAYESDLRDKKHGRVYRLVHHATPVAADSQPLDRNQPDQWVQALARDNQFWRKHAQRLLVERGERDVVPALLKLVQDPAVDAIGLNVGAIHALWTLQGLGVVTADHPPVLSAVHAALRHPSAGVRMNAIRVLPATADSVAAIEQSGLLTDGDAQVQLAGILALADLPANPAAGRAVSQLLQQSSVMGDRWLAEAVTGAAAQQTAGLVAGLVAVSSLPEKSTEALAIVGEHVARGRPTAEELTPLLHDLARAPAAVQEPLLLGLRRGSCRGWSAMPRN
jgi:hypothetical protein